MLKEVPLHGEREQGGEDRMLTLSRVLRSKTLSGSGASRQILKFIAEKSLADCVDEIKEYTIATQALGRPEDFDPRTDNIVRVQVRQLRKKLEEYYRAEGANDRLRIVIPIGHYHAEFQPVIDESGVPQNPERAPTRQAGFYEPNPFRTLAQVLPWVLASVLFVLLFVLRSHPSRISGINVPSPMNGTPLPDPLSSLWKPFLSSTNPPLIVFSNAPYLMSSAGVLYRYSLDSGSPVAAGTKVSSVPGIERLTGLFPQGTGSLYYFDLYTGTGEVVAAARVAQLLTSQDRTFSIKRSGVASFEDLRNSNVVFLGASLEDPLLKDVPVESDLVFEQSEAKEFIGNLHIRDRHPPAGQPSIYELLRDGKTKKLEGEYALISLLPSVVPDRRILVLGGLSTLGTQAAAEFATSAAAARAIETVQNASAAGGKPWSYFQVLLKVDIRDGVVVKTVCLLVREVRPQSLTRSVK